VRRRKRPKVVEATMEAKTEEARKAPAMRAGVMRAGAMRAGVMRRGTVTAYRAVALLPPTQQHVRAVSSSCR